MKAIEDQFENTEEAVTDELYRLWGDLEGARRNALNGRWSIDCDDLTMRIVKLSLASGIHIPWERIGYGLLTRGIWQGIMKSIGANVPMPTPDDLIRKI